MTPEEQAVHVAAFNYNLPLTAVPEARYPMVEAVGSITEALKAAK